VSQAWNTRIIEGQKPEYIAGPERDMLGIRSDERGGVLLNHLIDVHYFYLEF
jgi:hypothetical protein